MGGLEVRNYWSFATAGEIILGNGSINSLGEIIGKFKARNVLIVCDPGIKQAGIMDKALGILAEAGLNVIAYDQAEPEPPVCKAIECYQFAKNQNIEVIVGLGGGSSIDLAKVVAVLLTYGGDPKQYFGEFKVPGPVLPLIAVPTTSGTGTEVTPAAVLTDEEANLKVGVSDNYIRPAVALVDPELTLGLPPHITAHTGMDVLCHAIEAYTAVEYRYLPVTGPAIYQGTYELTDTLALKSIELAAKSLRLAVEQGHNLQARADMALASVLAGMAFSNAGVGAAHALAYPIGAECHAPHGLLVGLLLPHVMEYNLPVQQERFARVAVAMEENINGLSVKAAAMAAVNGIKDIIADIKMVSRLRDLGIQEDLLPLLAERTLAVTRLLRSNPRRLTAKDMEGILRNAY
ncbi:alcohol dehydrogenase [Clostridiales bacterium PH28_bin88]|nr:alcohol dehydrogenase [Clostridiales bacterium PH28_bin88]